MYATTTTICVIIMETAGGTIRAPLPLAIRYLLGCSQLAAEQVQVPGRVEPFDPVEDGAAAHDDVDSPARDLGRVGDGHSAVHADQHVGAGPGGQLAHVAHPLPGVGRGRLAGPAGTDRE